GPPTIPRSGDENAEQPPRPYPPSRRPSTKRQPSGARSASPRPIASGPKPNRPDRTTPDSIARSNENGSTRFRTPTPPATCPTEASVSDEDIRTRPVPADMAE